MGQIEDLFGDLIDIPESYDEDKQHREQEYKKYLASTQWRRLREAKLKQTYGHCEVCGAGKYQTRLEIHHKTYARFKHETLDDLSVLCAKCHFEADLRRQQENEKRRKDRLRHSKLMKGFKGWIERKYPLYDVIELPKPVLEKELDAFLEYIGLRSSE